MIQDRRECEELFRLLLDEYAGKKDITENEFI